MLLAAFALGAWLAWLLGALGPVGSRPRRESGSAVVGAFLFAVAATFLIWTSIDNYLDAWPSVPVRIVNFLVAPAQLWLIVAFFAGWYTYRYRTTVAAFFSALLMGSSPRKNSGAEASPGQSAKSPSSWTAYNPERAPAGATNSSASVAGHETRPPGGSDGGAGEPTGAAPRLTVVGLLVLVALLAYLGPDLRSRLSSFKFGNVEANFSTATQRSLNSRFDLGAQSHDNTSYAPNSMILELGGLKDDFALLFGPAGRQIAEYSGLAPADAALLSDRQERVRKFYEQIAVPLIEAISCDRGQLPLRDAEIQQHLILLATKWRDLSEKAVRNAGGNPDSKILFNQAVKETRDLINQIYDKYSNGPSPCTKPNPKAAAIDLDAFTSELMKNGYVIAFVSSLVASTHDYLRAVEYLNGMAPSLDTNSADPAGKMYFYVKRYETKYYGRWYPRDALSDLKVAIHSLDGMRTAIISRKSQFSGSDEAITYLDATRAGFLNMEIFSRIRDWLEGHRFSSTEIDSLEASSRDFQKWAQTQSPTALADNVSDWMTGPTIHLVATAYDTLAMSDIVIGQNKNDLGKDRCARIMERLVTSRNIFEFWSRVYVNAGKGPESAFRDIFKTLDAHRDLYESICAT